MRIKDIGTVVTGKTPSTASTDNWLSADFMFITPDDVTDSTFKIVSTKRSISHTGFNSVKNNKISGISIPVTCIGEIGRCGIVNATCVTNQQINTITNIDTSLVDPYALYYWVKLCGKQIEDYASKTVTPIVSKSIFENIDIALPSLATQHRIASVLSALDNKIELNDKINQKLNELARLIYDYWFVQFDFPDEHGRPYRASGGKMVYNDLLKCEIPAGWTVEHLDKILTFQRGTEPGSKAYLSNKTSESCIKFHRVGDMLGNCTTWIDGSIYKLYRVKPSDVLVSFDATIGRISTCIDGAISGGIRHIYDPSERISSAFIWQLFQSQRIQDQMLQFVSGRGSSLAHAGGVIKDLAIPYNKTSIQKYQDIVNPIYQLYINNQLESQQLAQLRDWLLPMLMSGQVVVK